MKEGEEEFAFLSDFKVSYAPSNHTDNQFIFNAFLDLKFESAIQLSGKDKNDKGAQNLLDPLSSEV